VRVFVCRPDELGASEITAWQAMQRATPAIANPFLSPEFTLAVGRFQPGARVAVLVDGQSTVGFFPFERRRLGFSVPICGWPGSLCQGLVHVPGVEWDARELLRQCQLSAWQFDHLVASQQPFVPYHAVVAPSPAIDLSDGFASYYAKIQAKSPRFCKDLIRRGRRLGRDAGDLRFVINSCDTSSMRTLMVWKSEQYRRIGAIDRFDRPWIVGLLDALHATRSEHVSSVLSFLYSGETPIAAQFGLRSGGLFAGWFTAYDHRFSKYSPGLLQTMRLTEGLAAVGVRTIDMGKGPENYKQKLKCRDFLRAEGIVSRGSVLAATHRARSTSSQWAARTLFQHPHLYHATRGVRSAAMSLMNSDH